MHHRDVKTLLQALLDIETLRGLDIFKVDTTKCRSDALYCLTEFLRVFLIDLDIEDVDATIYLEEKALTLHNRFSGHSTNITESQNGCTIRDNSDEITLVGISVRIIGVILNLKTGVCHTG